MSEPLIYVEDVKPDLLGSNGSAWRMDIAAFKRRCPGGPPIELTVATWIVHAPYAHPMWHSYTIAAVSLRSVPGWPPARIHMPGATHEVMVYALNGKHRRALNAPMHLLQPSNFHGQWRADDDAAAARFIEETVQLVIDGRLSLDTDARRDWIARFSASNMKGPDIPPGLVVLGDGAVTFVGTGKQNAENMLNVAAGPKPPKEDMH